ncbi:two-component system, OmpR family, alkaline phosphatase synthesis response regulator PhoP [Alkalithermobacter thermoalcaliphilus JW-YL-7 = DSM 7308]|uniref:Stage 0 sporulation protein A homolog n=1 Tax=Alkalithermobacter thermoalcaliphilus JW-YL-7 = DSM 7308 TaxID=1121328 RepID=A0A150FPL8_CLOPD|nr:two component transcriptional regulator, winged helix family [[Clostridium] paradoxum JW-YL-7 = DSM 7308]SHK97900.1 two-component system, OmpR family, alkaline phosphatase synthesis response regulator PhoP [[Clostridium] paradoxum JW-YL-7 = DSM 7308]
MDKKILIVDDEEHIVELLKFNLSLQGYKIDVAYDGLDAFVKIRENKPDLIILDVMIPSIDGFGLLKKVRSEKEIKDIPVIMLTAKDMEEYKIQGLQIGADDYITKPFSIKELIARVSAVLRRYNAGKDQSNEIVVGDIKIDLENYEVTKNGKKIDLTLKEFELLKILAENRGKVLSRNLLLDKIWGYEYFGETRTVDVHIRHLRKKIEDEDKNPQYIETIRGVGYKLK